MDGAEQVELRQMMPRAVADVLDAVSLARGLTRTDLVNQILVEYTDKRVHEATLICRLSRGNPCASDTSGRKTD